MFLFHKQTVQQESTANYSRFHLSGHTLGFRPQTQKLEPPCAV